jgi:hypothetical protein
MYDADTVRRAFRLADEGLTQQAVADTLGVGQSTVGRWLRAGLASVTSSPLRSRATSACPESCAVVAQAPANRYAYLLGQYLGDGTIVQTRNGVSRLFITCCASYPDIVDECSAAVRAVLPHNRVWHRPRDGAIDVSCYSAHLPCLFPQHGPGRKHERHIALATWQEEIALVLHPDRFLRGLIHSDGCRTVNRVRNSTGREYGYVRYQFANRSDDIRRLYTDACDRLGIEWRSMKRHDISVARQASVARLD